MSVRIRLTRTGRKNLAQWRVAVFDSRTRRDGRYLEMLGTYHPDERPDKKFNVNIERFQFWVSKGAVPTPSLSRLVTHAKALEAKKAEAKADKK